MIIVVQLSPSHTIATKDMQKSHILTAVANRHFEKYCILYFITNSPSKCCLLVAHSRL
jgi:hypothetical protein